MLLYVKEITELQLLKTARVKTGKETLTTKTVEWVSVIESPVENFVRKNEFVLSTGIGCHENVDLLLEFVKDVYDSGASALAIATGRYVFDIPEEVIQFAEQRQFILIDIPWEIRFADIVHEVMSKLNQLKQNELNHSKDIHHHLIQMILEEKPLDHLATYIEEQLNYPILICNHKGEAISGRATPARIFSLWNQLNRTESKYDTHHPLHAKMRRLVSGDEQLFHLMIQTNGNHEGDLFVLSTAESYFSQMDMHIIEHATVALALWFSRNSAVIESETDAQYEFILGLARGEKMTEEYVLSRTERFSFNLDLPYECIVGLPENLNKLFTSDTNRNWFEKMKIHIKEEMIYAAEAVQRNIMFASEGQEFIIFLETANGTSSDTVNQFLDLVERRLSHMLPGIIFSWGIGKQRDGVGCFHNSFQKAKAALDMGRSQRGIGKRVHFEETRINRLLLNLALDEDVQEITISTVSPLVDYDEKREMDLINTFIAYNNNSGNVSQTARDLNLHRQSLLYRLRKIESLTGLSLVNPDDLFLLDFSVKVWSTGVIDRQNVKAAL